MDIATIILVVVFLVVPLGYILWRTLCAIRCAECKKFPFFDIGEKHDFPIQEVLRGVKNLCVVCQRKDMPKE